MRQGRRYINNSYFPVAFIASVTMLTVEIAQTRSALPVEDTVVVTAAERQDWATVQSLIQEGADLNANQPDGATALHWAVHWNDLETVAALIEAGAEVDACLLYTSDAADE